MTQRDGVGGGEGGEEGRGHMYNYGRLALLYGRNPHNCKIVFVIFK